MLFNSLSLIGSNPSSHGFKSAGALKDIVEIIHILHSNLEKDWEIYSNFVALSEYMNFNRKLLDLKLKFVTQLSK